MMQEQDKLIPINAPRTDFEKFLDNPDNERIFFSGQFGIGKTFFLKDFSKSHPNEYDVYHLFPVNYQISSNENIVEFLKYDILVELLKEHPEAFEKQTIKGIKANAKVFAALFKDTGFGKHLLKSVFNIGISALSLSPDPISQAISKLGRPLGDLVELYKGYNEFKEEYLSGDGAIVDKYLKTTESDYDRVATDHIEHLIRKKIKTTKKDKRSVLILDDFDRIDPEHIFRVLNVLSAHLENDKNKFGFDHIIIVGDIENLQSIFHHKYGDNTKFWGYFDKFFTIQPYHFNNVKAITERVPDLLRLIKYEDQNLKKAIGPEGGIIRALIEEVLNRAFKFKAVNLRQIYKLIDHSFQEVRTGAYVRDHRSDGVDSCVEIGVRLLIAIYGTESDFLEVLGKIRADASKTPRQSKTLLYSDIASSMLRSMLSFKRVGERQSWLDTYTVEATILKRGSGWDINLVGGINARFFYDTLYEYVSRSGYIK